MVRRGTRPWRPVPKLAGFCTGLLLCVVPVPVCHASEPVPAADPPQEKPLDLRLGDIRRYASSAELTTPLPNELEEVTIQGRSGTPDMVETRPVPMGLGALFFAVRHPTQLWRIFVPDPNFKWAEDEDR